MSKPTCDGIESAACPLNENRKPTPKGRRQGAPPARPAPRCPAEEEEEEVLPHEHLASLERVRATIWLAKLSALLMAFIVVISVGIFAFLAITNNTSDTSFLGELFVNLHAIIMAVITAGK